MAILTEAVESDRATDYEKAYELYQKGLERILAGLKFEKDPTRKKMFEERAEGYLDRAEQLQKAINDNKNGQNSGGSGGATMSKPNSGELGKEEDQDTSKLKGALAGAIVMEKPNVKWDDVAGLEGAKDALKEAVILPVKFPQLFTGNRKPWKGILMYGPPGTGKSYLAKAVATEADATFFSVSSSDLVSKWQGESERLVRNLFEMARDKKPSIVFIDEIDSLCGARGEGSESESARRIKTEFLVQMQGVGKSADGVLVLAATNTPWEIDAAMRRRFEKRIYIPLPESHARATMFKVHLGSTPHNLTEGDFIELGNKSEGMSGSDVSVVVREALMEPLRICRMAKFFRPSPENDGTFVPVVDDPPCPNCPINLSTRPVPAKTKCSYCGCIRMSLMDLEGSQLRVPDVAMDDFRRVMLKGKASVAQSELERYEQFTKEFGQEGV
jgi:vacuolar protein-sorting-associated protein 4